MATQLAQSNRGRRQQQSSERSPLAEIARWEQQMERRFADLFSGRITRFWDDNDDSDITEPALDLYEDGNEIVVKAELPGMTKDDIQISFADNVLTIRGEKKKDEEDRGQGSLSIRASIRRVHAQPGSSSRGQSRQSPGHLQEWRIGDSPAQKRVGQKERN
jgi:HSP20 family molecular chaperone IbpA